jgi:hypothetical protein
MRRQRLMRVSVVLLLVGVAAAALHDGGGGDGRTVTATDDRARTPRRAPDPSEGWADLVLEAPSSTTDPTASATTTPPSPTASVRRSGEPGSSPAPTTSTTPRVVGPPPTTTTTTPPHFYDPTGRATAPPGPSPLCDEAVSFEAVSTYIVTSGVFTVAGGRVERLVSGTNGGVWSPGRDRVAFQAPADDNTSADLCVLEVGARSARRVATVSWPDGGAYAPGASELWAGEHVVANDEAVTGSLVAVATASGQKTAITKTSSFDVSPDGTRVAVLEPMDSADRHLRIHDLRDGTARVLSITRRRLAPVGVQWIDGETVAFGNANLVVKHVGTGAETEVVPDGPTPLAAWAYSRTLGRFAYTLGGSQPMADDGLYTVGRDGSDRQFIRKDPTLNHFVWSADGQSLLAVHGQVDSGQALRVDSITAADSTPIATSAPGYAFRLRDGWSPDGSRIEFSVMRLRFA